MSNGGAEGQPVKVPPSLLDQLRQWQGASPASAPAQGLVQAQVPLPLLPPLPPLPRGQALWVLLHRMWRQSVSVRAHTDCRGEPYEAGVSEGTGHGGGACNMGLAVARLLVARDGDDLALATSSGWVDVHLVEPGPATAQLVPCSLAGREAVCLAGERAQQPRKRCDFSTGTWVPSVDLASSEM